MASRPSYEAKYDTNADTVLSSKNRVAAAGRWKGAAEVEAERARHYRLMENLP